MKFLPLITIFFLTSCSSKSWREASRESVGIAPKASELKEAIVQIYYARAFAWRGAFGVHPWIAWKEVTDKEYTVAQVTAWNIRREGTAVSVKSDLPDRKWFDSSPTLMFEARGERAEKIIKQIKPLLKTYPYKDTYRVWPGPNSNTFIAYLTREIKELNIELPATAIGKDYLGASLIQNTPSNTGFTFSLFGALGFSMGLGEGIELNILGLHLGFDFWTPALKLPIIGRLGFEDKEI